MIPSRANFQKTVSGVVLSLGLLWLAEILPAAEAVRPPAIKKARSIFAGGVAGVEALAVATNSSAFRAGGGGLYLHNNGWGSLTVPLRQQVLEVFSNAPVAIELGFGGTPSAAKAWASAWQTRYMALGIKPEFIAANAFASNNHPTRDQWVAYMAALYAAGVPTNTLIMPTFEYQNFRPNIATLPQNMVSKNPEFQAIIRAAGGIVLDTPPGYFFSREPAYHDWVVDAIHWTQGQELKSVVIVSPHHSKTNFVADTRRFLEYLGAHKALPDILAVENYTAKPPADYPNNVGNENEINTALGVARSLQLEAQPK